MVYQDLLYNQSLGGFKEFGLLSDGTGKNKDGTCFWIKKSQLPKHKKLSIQGQLLMPIQKQNQTACTNLEIQILQQRGWWWLDYYEESSAAETADTFLKTPSAKFWNRSIQCTKNKWNYYNEESMRWLFYYPYYYPRAVFCVPSMIPCSSILNNYLVTQYKKRVCMQQERKC